MKTGMCLITEGAKSSVAAISGGLAQVAELMKGEIGKGTFLKKIPELLEVLLHLDGCLNFMFPCSHVPHSTMTHGPFSFV